MPFPVRPIAVVLTHEILNSVKPMKFLAVLKSFFYSLNLLGVKEKVLGIDPRKILTPVSGL